MKKSILTGYSNIRDNKTKKFILTTIFIMVFAVSAFAAPVANAGSDMTVFVGEAIRLDGSASTHYKSESQTDGTWSIRWQTGDGYDAENIIKCPHVYTVAGVYTATPTAKDFSGVTSVSSIRVTVVDIPAATGSNVQTLTDSGNPETNKANLQAAVNKAATNPATNEILVPAGFVFNDALLLRARSVSNYVTIRVANLNTLPANTRVTANDKAKLFRMNMRGISASGKYYALQASVGANYYRIIGMEIRHVQSEVSTEMFGIEFTANGKTDASHIILDRNLFDGNGFETRRALAMNGKTLSIINSSILNIKALGVETKAVANWTGSGALGVINCRVEAASINALIGGAPISGVDEVLDGFVFRGNHVWKSPSWIGYVVKNSFELKQGYNTVAVGNIFENNYADGQAGEAIVIKSMTDEGCAYCEVANLDFRNNKILNTRAGFNVINMQAFNLPYPPYANHIRFVNNFWQQTHGRGNLSQGADYFEIIHNTFTSTDAPEPVVQWVMFTNGSSGVPADYKAQGFKALNNFVYDSYYQRPVVDEDGLTGTDALNANLTSDWRLDHNVIPNVRTDWQVPNNFYPTIGKSEFIDYAGGNYSLKSDSIYKNAGTDGKDIGADISVINSSTASVISGIWSSATTTPNPTPTPTPTPTNSVATVSASSSTVAPGGALNVSFSGVSSPTTTDWIGVYNVGASNYSYLSYVYTSSGTQSPGSTAFSSGTRSITFPTTPGVYELRLNSNNGFTNLATSSPVTVTSSTTATPTPVVTPTPIATPTPTNRINVALAANGGVASASSYYSSNYTPSAAINGDRKALNWSANGYWNDATVNSYPDWLQVDFNGSKTIDEIDVYTFQDNYSNPVEPTENTLFSIYGITNFDVQYWNGSSWVTVPNGNVINNNKILTKLTFSPITTTRIRVVVNSSLRGYSRIVEVEAWSM